jgi:hypothetical protein
MVAGELSHSSLNLSGMQSNIEMECPDDVGKLLRILRIPISEEFGNFKYDREFREESLLERVCDIERNYTFLECKCEATR